MICRGVPSVSWNTYFVDTEMPCDGPFVGGSHALEVDRDK